MGKDILLEQEPDVYEPLDLGFGFCRLVVAEPRELWERDDPAKWSWVRVATKYPRLAEQYFSARGVQVELVRLDGSIELAPLVGLAERIVDLVQSGETLRANGLVEVAEIARSTARLIVNRAAMKTEYAAITELIGRLRQSHDAIPNGRAALRAPAADAAARPSIAATCVRAGRAGPATMKTLDARTLGVDAVIRAVDRPPSEVAPDVTRAVEQIIADVRARGDAALLEYTARFDGFGPAAAAGLAIPRGDFEAAEQTRGGARCGPRWPTPPSASSAITPRRCRSRGGSPTSTARCSARTCGRSSASASTSPAAARRIRPPC